MKNFFVSCLVSICLCLFTTQAESNSSPLAFSLHKLGKEKSGKTVLIVGGIQGDEPGGFHAASLLVTHYAFENGSVWVIPNLNFPSIVHRSRGLNGDLNRKFASISQTDPEFEIIERIKTIISNNEVDLVLNLHDGSGYYSETFVDELHGPQRWGQSVIIDQEEIQSKDFSHLGEIGRKVTEEVNTKLNKDKYHYALRNTKTAEGDEEMAKTLTYFAINQNKPAFGIEASKSLNKVERVFCHLNVIEAFLKQAGINFTRQFNMEVADVEKALSDNRQIAFYDNRIFLEMENIRNQVNFFPIYKAKGVDFTSKNPLITIVPTDTRFDVYHGNEKVTTLVPQYFESDDNATPPKIKFLVDEKPVEVEMGQTISVKKSFEIQPTNGYRANIIGFMQKGKSDESGLTVQQQDCDGNYSLNTNGNIFRVEFYRSPEAATADYSGKNEKFSGMVTIRFLGAAPKVANSPSARKIAARDAAKNKVKKR